MYPLCQRGNRFHSPSFAIPLTSPKRLYSVKGISSQILWQGFGNSDGGFLNIWIRDCMEEAVLYQSPASPAFQKLVSVFSCWAKTDIFFLSWLLNGGTLENSCKDHPYFFPRCTLNVRDSNSQRWQAGTLGMNKMTYMKSWKSIEMPPVSTGFADKLWLWDPSPEPDKLQVLRGSSSQTGSQGVEGAMGGLGRCWEKTRYQCCAQLEYPGLYPCPTSTCFPCPIWLGADKLLPLP